jgi:hypothetical protein
MTDFENRDSQLDSFNKSFGTERDKIKSYYWCLPLFRTIILQIQKIRANTGGRMVERSDLLSCTVHAGSFMICI